MKKKLLKSIIVASAITALSCITVFAAGWKSDSNGWWYATNDAGTEWYSNGWQWVDGNNDGIAECYYFEPSGYITMNGTTADGYQVNANGAWIVDGVIQTKNVGSISNNVAVVERCPNATGENVGHNLELGVCTACGKVDYSEYYPWFVGVWSNSRGAQFVLNADGTCKIEGTDYDNWKIYSSDYGYKQGTVDGKMGMTDIPEKEYFYARVNTPEGHYSLQYVYNYEPTIKTYQRIINLSKYDQNGKRLGSQTLFVKN